MRVRAHLPQKFNNKGTEADILARKYDPVKQAAHTSDRLLLIITIIFLAIGYFDLLDPATNVWMKSNWFIPAIILGIAVVLDYLIEWEYTWVECKNLKGTAEIKMIDNLLSKYTKYNELEKKEFKITDLIFASAKGYKENAIKQAEDKGIRCFELSNEGNFIESKYWN